MLQRPITNYRLKKSPTLRKKNTTFMLGSRCSDGVVIVSDRKFTIDQSGSIYSIYGDKLNGYFFGVISGFAGTRRDFELFMMHISEYVKENNNYVPIEKFLLKATEITKNLPYKDYDILFGIRGPPSDLKHMYSDGGIESITEYVVIGTGEPVSRFLLKKNWKNDMTIRQVAELGYFIIKVIERYQLDETVGLDKLNEHFENKPQIWFIPDNESDYPASKDILLELEEKINERIKKLENEQFF